MPPDGEDPELEGQRGDFSVTVRTLEAKARGAAQRVIRMTGKHAVNIRETGRDRGPANHVALTPLSYLDWAEAVYPDKLAVIHGARSFTYRKFGERCRRLASALRRRGVGLDDTVSVMAPNIPALVEAQYGVPMAGAVLNALNIRLDADTIAFVLEHGDAKVLITDIAFSRVIEPALAKLKTPPLVIDIDDPERARDGKEDGEPLGEIDYEAFLATGDADFAWHWPEDEWQVLALNYTSGTTGSPKGVVYHHRGGFLNALGNVITFGLDRHSVYLWTLPMFHCNGWCYTWAVTAVAGTHICLRRPDPALIFGAIRAHGVSHMCGAPIVLNLLIHAPDEVKVKFDHTVEVACGGAAPPSALIASMERMGFRVTHLYGLTESFGPSMFCAWQDDWEELDQAQRAMKTARQGVRLLTLNAVRVADPQSMRTVPADGKTMGEIMLRGNTVMQGYLKDRDATEEAFRGGWFHTGDLAVRHQDGYIEIKDRSKDVIISGGENISSLEVEEVLYQHPGVMEAAVVARPDDRWGEAPCAFVTPKPGMDGIGAEEIIAWCRERMAHFKCPKSVIFGPLPKTSTGKIQKFVLRERAKALEEP